MKIIFIVFGIIIIVALAFVVMMVLSINKIAEEQNETSNQMGNTESSGEAS